MRVVLFLTMAVWGLNLSAVKVLAAHIDTLALASLRMSMATFAMTAFAGGGLAALVKLDRRQMLCLAACAALMVYGNQVLLLSGMKLSSASNAALIVALSPLAALLVAVVALRERPSRSMLAGVLVGFCGVCVVVLARPSATLSTGTSGDVLLLFSVFSFALGGALVQRLARELDPMVISWAIHAVGAGMLVAHAWISHSFALPLVRDLGPSYWALLVFSGAVATGLGNLVWNKSIAVAGVGRTTAALYWVPIFGILFAVVALDEKFSWLHVVGLAAVLVGTWITSIGVRNVRHSESP